MSFREHYAALSGFTAFHMCSPLWKAKVEPTTPLDVLKGAWQVNDMCEDIRAQTMAMNSVHEMVDRLLTNSGDGPTEKEAEMLAALKKLRKDGMRNATSVFFVLFQGDRLPEGPERWRAVLDGFALLSAREEGPKDRTG